MNKIILIAILLVGAFTGRELTTTPFPNTTTLYGWNINGTADYVDGDFVGGQALTENGALTASDNHLGVSVFGDFDGSNDYLTNNNAAFNFTGDFSVGGWFYRSDWSIVVNEDLIGRFDFPGDDNGWRVVLFSGGQLNLITYSSGQTSAAGAGYTGLSAGWHHFVWVRNAGTNVKHYQDGILVETDTDATDAITEEGTLEVGAGNGGQNKFTGRIADIFIHNATILSDNEVRAIYLWSKRRRIF